MPKEPEDVELQPYTLHVISHELPVIHRKLGEFQPIVPLTKCTKDYFVIRLPGLGREFKFFVPEAWHPLFFRPAGFQMSLLVHNMMREGYEATSRPGRVIQELP